MENTMSNQQPEKMGVHEQALAQGKDPGAVIAGTEKLAPAVVPTPNEQRMAEGLPLVGDPDEWPDEGVDPPPADKLDPQTKEPLYQDEPKKKAKAKK